MAVLRQLHWEPLQPLPRMQLGGLAWPQGESLQHAANGSAAAVNDGMPLLEEPAEAGLNGTADVTGTGGKSSIGGAGDGAPDLDCCLLHQKLQLLDVCIGMQLQQRQQQDLCAGAHGAGEADGCAAAPLFPSSSTDSLRSSGSSYRSANAGSDAGQDSPAKSLPPSPRSAAVAASAAASMPVGVAAELPGGAALHLHPERPVRVPIVQLLPSNLTEDTLAEQQAALEVRRWQKQHHPATWLRQRLVNDSMSLLYVHVQALAEDSDGAALRRRLQGRMLLSDMQAFKAANPGACLLGECSSSADGEVLLNCRQHSYLKQSDGRTYVSCVQTLFAGIHLKTASLHHRQRPATMPVATVGSCLRAWHHRYCLIHLFGRCSCCLLPLHLPPLNLLPAGQRLAGAMGRRCGAACAPAAPAV